jgi:hypothetical protein
MTSQDFLRYTSRLFDKCNMSLVGEDWTPEELLNIARACRASEWDVYPDQWTETQLQAAAEHADPPRFKYGDDMYSLIPLG